MTRPAREGRWNWKGEEEGEGEEWEGDWWVWERLEGSEGASNKKSKSRRRELVEEGRGIEEVSDVIKEGLSSQ